MSELSTLEDATYEQFRGRAGCPEGPVRPRAWTPLARSRTDVDLRRLWADCVRSPLLPETVAVSRGPCGPPNPAATAEVTKRSSSGGDALHGEGAGAAGGCPSGRASSDDSGALCAFAVSECVGHGGFGRVYRGAWMGLPAAIKVCACNGPDDQGVAAMEMAVLSIVQHPNIVQLYTHLTDVVEACAPTTLRVRSFSCSSLAAWGSSSFSRIAYRRLQPGEAPPPDAQPSNVLVLEWCDRGSLRTSARAGMFTFAGPPRGATAAVVALMDVAHALDYLHSCGIAHGDVKLDNVLLRSDALQPLGVTCKLADFGLACLLGETGAAPNDGSGAGTLSHLAPELFNDASPVTAAIDVYAFGVMMWDLYMGGTALAYPGLSKEAVKRRVTAGARPKFPAGAPPAYEALARDCWAADPAARPSMAEVLCGLEALLAACTSAPVL